MPRIRDGYSREVKILAALAEKVERDFGANQAWRDTVVRDAQALITLLLAAEKGNNT